MLCVGTDQKFSFCLALKHASSCSPSATGEKDRTRGSGNREFSSEEKSQLHEEIDWVCREPPYLRVMYGLVTATFLHSAASERHIPARKEEKKESLKGGGMGGRQD